MGGTLTTEDKEEFCTQMTGLYLFCSCMWTPYLDVILVISAIVSGLVAFQVFYHKHLQSNPAPIIAAICLSESYFGFTAASRHLVCGGFNAEGLVAMTLYWDNSHESQLKAMRVIANTYTFLMYFSYNFTAMIELFLHIDLIQTIKRPM